MDVTHIFVLKTNSYISNRMGHGLRMSRDIFVLKTNVAAARKICAQYSGHKRLLVSYSVCFPHSLSNASYFSVGRKLFPFGRQLQGWQSFYFLKMAGGYIL